MTTAEQPASNSIDLQFAKEPSTDGKILYTITARDGATGEVIHAQLLDLKSEPDRQDFAGNVTAAGNLEGQEPSIENELLKELARQAPANRPDDIYTEFGEAETIQRIKPAYRNIAALRSAFPNLNKPIIHEIAREREIINIIGSSKTMKTWLATYLALCVGTGRAFLNHYRVEAGPVLYLDNELHEETASFRISKILEAMELSPDDVGDNFAIENFRGRLITIDDLDGYLRQLPENYFKVIIVDALYKFLPRGTDENDNAQMAAIYCRLDNFAKLTGAAFIIIHHASKGIQGGKAITDVGSGAGSISRSADSHLALRPHEEDGVCVLDGETRSWGKLAAQCLEWNFPLFQVAPDLDPTLLKVERARGGRPRKTDEGKPEKAKPHIWTAEDFAKAFVSDTPKSKELIIAKASAGGVGSTTAKTLLVLCEDGKMIHRHQIQGDNKAYFATVEPTLIDMSVCVARPPSTPSVPRRRTRTRK